MYETYRQDSYRAALAKIIYLYLQRRDDQSYHKNLQRLSKGCRGARTGVTVRVSRRGLRALMDLFWNYCNCLDVVPKQNIL